MRAKIHAPDFVSNCRSPPCGRETRSWHNYLQLLPNLQVCILWPMARSILAPGTKALRSGRNSGENQVYHITSCTFDRAALFVDFQIGRLVVKSMIKEEGAGYVHSLAFVVMPDHFHWLFQLTNSRPLSTVINKVKSQSARLINERLSRQRPVWQKGFHDRAIRRDEDLTAVARYIVANPLRAGIVGRIGDYPLWDAIWV